jgi:hypothetical protein
MSISVSVCVTDVHVSFHVRVYVRAPKKSKTQKKIVMRTDFLKELMLMIIFFRYIFSE